MREVVTVVGAGYVGLTMGATLAYAGYQVHLIDVDKQKVDIIRSGKSHFYEVGLDEVIKNGLNKGTLLPTTSYDESIPKSSIVFSCVGTPDLPNGAPNLEYINAVAEKFAKLAKDDAIFVQKSTVPVGTGAILTKLIKTISPKLNFHYVSNPEFLREGSALFDTLNMDRIVVGNSDNDVLDRVVKLHKSIAKLSSKMSQDDISKFANAYKGTIDKYSIRTFDDRVIRTTLESAELIKVTANAFLALKVSFANSIALLCDKTNADVTEVMNGIGADSRIGRSFLYAGIGYGGGCFPKDVSGLIKVSEEHGVEQKIMKTATTVNDDMVNFMYEKIVDLKPKKIGLLGLSFKPGTSDVRKSQSIKLANKLTENGYSLKAYDPKAIEDAKQALRNPEICTNEPNDVFRDAEVIIIATDWPEFKEYNWKKIKSIMKTPYILDGRNQLDKELVKSLGFEYMGIGRR